MDKEDDRYTVTKEAPNGKAYGGYKVFTDRAKALAEARLVADLLPTGWTTRCHQVSNGNKCIWIRINGVG